VSRGDVAQADAGDGTKETFAYTGEEWVRSGNVYSVADLGERDHLGVQKGDVVKVADADGTPKSFIYDGQDWIKFYMTGDAGTITIHASDEISLKDDASLSTASAGGIHAGTIHLDTADLRLSDSASVSSTSEAIGDAGAIRINATGTVTLEDDTALTTASSGAGKAGDIMLEAAGVELRNDASVSSASLSQTGGGEAGTVTINTDDSVRLSDNGSLTTNAKSAGGGKISVNAGNDIYLFNGEITSSVSQSGSDGDGGDIRIGDSTGKPRFVILNHGDIAANADKGDGGAIFIHTNDYIKSADSVVEAKSARGNDGVVRIEAPDTDVSGDLVILPGTILDATQWMRKSCSKRSGEKVSRFVIRGRDALPTALDDWPSPPIWFEDFASDEEPDREEQKGSKIRGARSGQSAPKMEKYPPVLCRPLRN